ncbi:hypothetical protein ACFQ60_14410 [Streptomyces zhihengii]
MTSFSADPDGSDAPFTGIGDPVLVVTDKRRSLVAVAGEREYDEAETVGLFHVTDRARRRWLLLSRYPVTAMAFHPTLPLLAVGSGEYDGGYFFEGSFSSSTWRPVPPCHSSNTTSAARSSDWSG